MRIAALLTCHNRKEKTIECLSSLYKYLQDVDVYLVDDASNDGTADVVRLQFPQVHLIIGTGNLFWSRGMYIAWKEAQKKDYDYYLWINDDVILYPCFWKELTKVAIPNNKVIVSGIIESVDKTEILYGGSNENKKLVIPQGKPLQITYMNGNVVLIPSFISKEIGIIDPYYHHDLGDVDYGLRAIKAGFKVISTGVPVAAGYKNGYCRVRKWNSNLIGRIKRLYSPLGANPRINFYFRRRHFGFLNAVVYLIYLHFLNIMPDMIIEAVYGDKYKDK